MTAMEREEKEKVKKREKKLEDEETMQQATWVKYTFPIKHQVISLWCHGRSVEMNSYWDYQLVLAPGKYSTFFLLCVF